MPPIVPPPKLVFTIGHSNRPLAMFLKMLQAHDIGRLVDVRTIPRSRHNPQFNRETLPGALAESGIAYTHLKDLGGLRHPRPDSINSAWQNDSFRGYADYMQTAEFASAIDSLIELSGEAPLAIMCAEAVPWRCHRSLIADALHARGYPVEHILSVARTQPHVLTPFARVDGTTVTYPGL